VERLAKIILLSHLAIFFLNISCYAIEELDEIGLPIAGIMLVQDHSRTIWDVNYQPFWLLVSPVLMQKDLEIAGEDNFQANIELKSSSFADTGNKNLFCFPYSDDMAWPDLKLNEGAVKMSVSIKIIDEKNRTFKLILGDKKQSSVSFIVKPDGIYNLEGTLEDSVVEFKWQGERFRLGVLKDEEVLKITLEPSSSDLFPGISYSKGFTLGNFEGALKFRFANATHYLELELNDADEKVANVNIDSEQACLNLNFQTIAGDKGIVSINVDSLTVKDNSLEGGGEVTAEENDQTVVLSLGRNRYLEINQNGSTREIIDEFFTELAEEMVSLLPQWAEEDEDVDSDMTVDDIKEMLWEATGDDLRGLADLIEEINEERQGLVVPDRFKFFGFKIKFGCK